MDEALKTDGQNAEVEPRAGEPMLLTAAQAAAETGVTFTIEKKPLTEGERLKALGLCAKILAEMLLRGKAEELREREELQPLEKPDRERDVPQILSLKFSDLKDAV